MELATSRIFGAIYNFLEIDTFSFGLTGGIRSFQEIILNHIKHIEQKKISKYKHYKILIYL